MTDTEYKIMAVHIPLHNENPGDIVNIANYVQCAYMDAWGFFFKYMETCKELTEIKGRKIEDIKCVEQ